MDSELRKRGTALHSTEKEGAGKTEAVSSETETVPSETETIPSETETIPSETEGADEANQAQLVKHVAEDMFSTMIRGFDEEVITEDNLEAAIENLADSAINPTYSLVQTQAYAVSSKEVRLSLKKLLEDIQKRSRNGVVTRELFCKAAVRLLEGKESLFDMLDMDSLTGMSEASAPAVKSGPPSKSQDRANLETLVYNPKGAATLIKREVFKVVEKRGSRWLWSFFSTKHFYWFLVVYFVPMLSIQVVVSSVSTALFNAVIVFLLIASVQTVINSEIIESRLEYLSLFQYFNKDQHPIKMPIENSDVFNSFVFISGVAMSMIFLGFSNHSFVYYELFASISLIVAGLVVLQYDLYESPFLWLSMLAKFPSWLLLLLEKLCSLLGTSPPLFIKSLKEPIFTIPVVGELYFDIDSVAMLQISLHFCLLAVIFAKRNTFQNPGPHVLFVGWFVLARNFVVLSSARHLAIVSTFVVLFPFYTIAFFLTPIYFLYYYGVTSSPFYYSLESIGIMAVMAVIIWFNYKHNRQWWMNLSIEYVLLFGLAACFGLVMFLSGWYASVFQVSKPLPIVSLPEYTKYCGPENWADGNSIQTQINCIHLQGRVLNGLADIETVSISSIQNSRAESISFLPYFLERAVTCHLGESEPMCGNRADMSTCIYTGCNFQHSLTYTFQIKLAIESRIKATMIVSHSYKDFVMQLKSGSVLHFNATFVDGMGTDHLTLQARSLRSFGQSTHDLEEEKALEAWEGMWSVFLQSVKNSAMMIFEIFFGYAT